jgi:hypothetical protein
LAGSDSTFENLSVSEIAKLIPMKPGKYTLNLDITYEGETVSDPIIFVLAEKVVYVDSSHNAQRLHQPEAAWKGMRDRCRT